MRIKQVVVFLAILLLAVQMPSISFAHDTVKRDANSEKQLYEQWMDVVEHSLVQNGVIDEKYHDTQHSHDGPLSRADYLAMLLKNVYSDKDLSKLLNAAGPCSYSDVKDKTTCKYVESAKKLQITSGFPDGSFKPGRPITRAELLAFTMKILPIPLSTGAPRPVFLDVDSKYWAFASITTGIQLKMLSGFRDGTFRPEQAATQGQAMIVLYDLLKLVKQANSKADAQTPGNHKPAPQPSGDLTIVWNNGMNTEGNIVAPGEVIPLEIELVRANADKVQLDWYASGGEISRQLEKTAIWTAPVQEGNYSVTVSASRANGAKTSVTEQFIVSNAALEQEFKFSDPANFIDNEAQDIDSDGDGLMDSEEKTLGTDPSQVDTDHDGLSDYFEVKVSGSDPLVANQ
jgi:hypothetical protein